MCSTTALSGLILVSIMYKITNIVGWLAGLTFWIFYFIFSLFLIAIGLYSRWKEKHFDEQKPRKDLKSPIV